NRVTELCSSYGLSFGGQRHMISPRPFEEIPYVNSPRNYFTRLGSFLISAYEQYGPIFRSKAILGGEVVYLIGPEANRFILSTDRLKFSYYEGWGVVYHIARKFGNGLLTMDGEEHDNHRRIMNPAFTLAYMERYLSLISRIVRKRVGA